MLGMVLEVLLVKTERCLRANLGPPFQWMQGRCLECGDSRASDRFVFTLTAEWVNSADLCRLCR